MPGMPRPNKKAQNIAFAILGVPANLQKIVKTPKQKQKDKQLDFEESTQTR